MSNLVAERLKALIDEAQGYRKDADRAIEHGNRRGFCAAMGDLRHTLNEIEHMVTAHD